MNYYLKNLGKYKEYIFYAARARLRSEVANSYLNWIWWVLEPIASMLIYFAIFSHVLGRGQPYYVLFIYSASLIWSFFNRCLLFDVQAVRLNSEIVTKVYVPKHVLLLSNLIMNGIKMLISVGILIVLLILFRVPFSPRMFYVLPICAILLIFTFGFGMILMHFGVFVDDLSHALNIFMRLVFYICGVFYDLENDDPRRSHKNQHGQDHGHNGPGFQDREIGVQALAY